MRYRELTRRLSRLGFKRYGDQGKGSHELWWLPGTERRAGIPNHASREIPAGTLRAILKQLGLTEEDIRKA